MLVSHLYVGCLTPRTRLPDSIIRNFNQLALVEDGSAEVDRRAPERDHTAILREVVSAELPELDEFFLAALNGYVVAASKRPDSKDNKQLLRLLLAVREETLRAVVQRLPPDVQAVDALSGLGTAAERAALLEEVRLTERAEAEATSSDGSRRELSGGAFPGASLAGVELAASQLVERMEDTDAVVADTALLARAALAREAARDALSRGGPPVSPRPREPPPQPVVTGAFPPSSLPRWEMGLLKELLAVGDPTVRAGLVRHALAEALELENSPDESAGRFGARPAGARPAGLRPLSARGIRPPPGAQAPPPVRPGRLLDCIANLRAETAKNEGLFSVEELRLDPLAARAELIREDVLAALQDMADFRG